MITYFTNSFNMNKPSLVKYAGQNGGVQKNVQTKDIYIYIERERETKKEI